MKKFDWNVVVVGDWNTAILTPAWIQENLFELDKTKEVSLTVPLNRRGPVQIGFQDVLVTPSEERLVIQIVPGKETFDTLLKAMRLASKALEKLPVTPIRASGYNIRYEVEAESDLLERLWGSELDSRLSEAGYQISGRKIERTLKHGDGRIGLALEKSDDNANHRFSLNFHRDSLTPLNHTEWLSVEKSNLVSTLGAIWDAVGISQKFEDNEYESE